MNTIPYLCTAKIFSQFPINSAEYKKLRCLNKRMYFVGHYANQTEALTKLVQYTESVLGENRYFDRLKHRINHLSTINSLTQVAQEDRAILWRIGELFVSQWISKPTIEVYHHIAILLVKDFDFVHKAFTQIIDVKAGRNEASRYKLLIPLNVLPLLPSHCTETALKIINKCEKLIPSFEGLDHYYAQIYIRRAGTTYFDLW